MRVNRLVSDKDRQVVSWGVHLIVTVVPLVIFWHMC